MEKGRFDSVSLAGIAVFSALATLLAAVSQSLGLNFPVVPYLQFDLGEVAIIMAFFIFGPLPAVASSFVEFVALMAFGQNAPVGPVLKLAALLSTVGGMWVGVKVSTSVGRAGLGRILAASAAAGTLVRVAAMTVANYYLVVYLYGLTGTVSYYGLPHAFSQIGLELTGANALTLVLAFTAVFNALQLAFVVVLSSWVLRFPPLTNMRVGGRVPWFVSTANARAGPEETEQ